MDIIGFMVLVYLIALIAQVFVLWMLVDCATNRSILGTDKIVWVLLIIFTNFLGAVLYRFLGRGRGAAV